MMIRNIRRIWWRNRIKCIIFGIFLTTVFIYFNNSNGIEIENPLTTIHKLKKVQPTIVRSILIDKEHNKSCNLTLENIPIDPAFSKCKAKIEWMISGWETHQCYKDYGVNGTICSFYNYLSTVESHCKPLNQKNIEVKSVKIDERLAQGLDPLFELMSDNPTNFHWIKSRITRLFVEWKEALRDLVDVNEDLKERKRMDVILYLGFLSKETGLKFGEKSGSGGPLGELVQWADLIASIYLLGHDLSIATELKYFKDVMMKPYFSSNPCPLKAGSSIDLIFTDIMGLRKIKQKMKQFYVSNKCRIRLLDSFGTHAEFNDINYYKEHWSQLGQKKKNPWGNHGLELEQFLTMYPHTDDNTFLGFVVEQFDVESNEITRENQALIYGKEKYMWENTKPVLETLNKFVKIAATVADSDETFDNYLKKYSIENQGLLNGIEFHTLLRKCKVFVGLGFPLEGPAALEAVANGAIFINHRFDPPKSRLTYKFFSDKPTLRELTSQNPYMERFVGEPYVYTVDVFNPSELNKTMNKIMGIKNEPYLPFEFSFEGMIERVDVILTKRDFCGMEQTWPPFESSRIILGSKGESCQDVCQQNELLCERSFFKKINTVDMLANYTDCTGIISEIPEPYAPSECNLQKSSLLFSCASHPPQDIRRLCPCRTYKKGQIVLCDSFC